MGQNTSCRITIQGKVQGVGFRPFVHSLARRFEVGGFIQNSGSAVVIELSGKIDSVNNFYEILRTEPPETAAIEYIDFEIIPFTQYHVFSIIESAEEPMGPLSLPYDEAICNDCMGDLQNPENRRFQYPFISCSRCGPRYSIQFSIPYDRKNTSMNEFMMCDECLAEYSNPDDRRFFAQTIGCRDCGPVLYDTLKGDPEDSNPLSLIEDISIKILDGKVGIIKGIGGFHLVGRADLSDVVSRIREIKLRKHKPLAVMIDRKQYLNLLDDISESEKKSLLRMSPVTVMKNIFPGSIAGNVAPGFSRVGFMPPCTGLHELLMNRIKIPIVMTSANISGEPILYDEEIIRRKFSRQVDFILSHDRKIVNSVDDSVVNKNQNNFDLVRPGRGAFPLNIRTKNRFESSVLGTGSDLKSTFCFGNNFHAFISPYTGDMENPDVQKEYSDRLEKIEKYFPVKGGTVASDLHPNYFSSQIGKQKSKEYGCRQILVQHHHAHLASCMFENSLDEPVIGIALDGTGYGTDGTVWGGEVLIADFGNFIHAGGIRKFPLYGGDTAIKETFRQGMALLVQCGAGEKEILNHYEKFVDSKFLLSLISAMKHSRNHILTSSCGRLFDAAASILNISQYNSFDAESSMLLEEAAGQKLSSMDAGEAESEMYDFLEENSGTDMADWEYGIRSKNFQEIDFQKLVRILFYCNENNAQKEALKFHQAVASAFVKTAKKLSRRTGLRKIALSGGCFLNSILLTLLKKGLESAQLEVFTHREIPCDDSGISVGQAAVGNFIASGKKSCVLQYL